MKKLIALLLAAVLLLPAASCGSGPAGSGNQDIVGGWTITAENAHDALPGEVREAYDKAMKDYADAASCTPLAYLGSQVVAGLNYAFLCRMSGDSVSLNIVKIYRDLQGNASVTEVNAFDLAACLDSEEQGPDQPALLGGWSSDEACGAGLDEAAQTAFEKAAEGLLGVNYTPLACLGTQVVAGTNYAILCKAVPVVQDPHASLAVMKIYADLSGGAELLSVTGFPIS